MILPTLSVQYQKTLRTTWTMRPVYWSSSRASGPERTQSKPGGGIGRSYCHGSTIQ